MYPKDGLKGLKGQKAYSPGPLDLWSLARQERPGLKSGATFALKGQKHSPSNNAFAPTGRGLRHLLLRAMPWAVCSLPLRGVNG